MIEMEIFQSWLRECLAFYHIEFGTELSEVGLSNECKIQVITFEDVINIIGLHLIGTDG